MPAEPQVVTRNELYELVWSKPATRIAAELGISDVMLGKLCRKLEVPKPPPGYWRKVATGQRLPKPPLPRARKGQQTAVTVRPQSPSPAAPAIDPDTAARIAAERQEVNWIVVPAQLAVPHALIERAGQVLTKARANEEGLLLAPASRPCLAISVAPRTLDRALRLMDALIHALEQRGYVVTVAADDGATWVKTPEGSVQLSLTEKVEREETERYRAAKASDRMILVPQNEKWIYRPSGQLRITATDEDSYHRMQWKDSTSRPLEQQLNLVLAGIIRTAEECRLHRIKLAEAERQRQEEERRRWEEARRRSELDRLARILEEQAAQWSRCESLRAFLQTCEERFKAAQGEAAMLPGSAEATWLRWAGEYVRGLDPLVNGAVARAVREVAASPVVRDIISPSEPAS